MLGVVAASFALAVNGLEPDLLLISGVHFVAAQRAHDLAEVELGDDLGAFLRVEEGLRGLALLANLCYVFHLVFLSCFAKQRRDVRRHYLRLGQNASADSGGVPIADSGGVSGSAWPCACASTGCATSRAVRIPAVASRCGGSMPRMVM